MVQQPVVHLCADVMGARHEILREQCSAAFYPSNEDQKAAGWESMVKLFRAGDHKRLCDTYGAKNFSQIALGHNTYGSRLSISPDDLPTTLPGAVDMR